MKYSLENLIGRQQLAEKGVYVPEGYGAVLLDGKCKVFNEDGIIYEGNVLSAETGSIYTCGVVSLNSGNEGMLIHALNPHMLKRLSSLGLRLLGHPQGEIILYYNRLLTPELFIKGSKSYFSMLGDVIKNYGLTLKEEPVTQYGKVVLDLSG